YNSSANGDKHLNVRIGNNVYGIENYREAFYRPDLVKLALSGGSLKDFKTLADVKQPPVVTIVDTPKSANKDEAKVTLKIVDIGGGIGDVRLYLNGSAVVLDSARGVKIVPTNKNEVLKTYNLKLTNGINTIRAIAFNGDNTMQSNDVLHEITASFKSLTKPSLNAIIVGINEYKNPKLQLKYAVSDAELFENTLKNVTAGLFEKVNIKKLITKENTTNENIIKELKAYKALNPDDVFVFFVASHGTVDDGEYFLITSNVGSTRTEKLKTDALPQGMLKELIANIPATKKLIIIDTCSAGALGEAIQVAMLTRGMSEDTAMKILSRAVGSTILSASTSLQEAVEGYQGHGLFTYVLVEGLKGKADKGKTGYVKTTELADYVDSEVPVLAEKVFKKSQYPTISISGQAFPIGKTGK
ncbi:MAG: caspase family protein, partial [Nitrospirae bacterium]|nr:caspase family protein [Nitrospirota bacterium]